MTVALPPRVSKVLLRWGRQYALTEAELVNISHAVVGLDQDAIAVARGVSANTVKKQTHMLCKRLGTRSLLDLARVALLAACGVKEDFRRRSARDASPSA